MNRQLIKGALLPSKISTAPAVPQDSRPLYRLVVGDVQLMVCDAESSVYAAFSRTDGSERLAFDITAQYRDDEWSILPKLVMAAYCQFCMDVDPDLDIAIWDAESVEIKNFSRDISSAVPEDSISEESLVREGNESEASGIHYFILQEETADNADSYCFIELGFQMPSYREKDRDALVSLFVMPKRDEREIDAMIAARRKQYVENYRPDLERLFTEFTTETLSLMGDHLSKASMQSVCESLAWHVGEWCVLSTKDALADLCPALLEMEIKTECEYDDAGGYFNSLTRITFKSQASQYIFPFDPEGFSDDEDLLDEDREFGGKEFETLQGILGPEFHKNQVFKLVETLGHLMMRRDSYSETINQIVGEVAACS